MNSAAHMKQKTMIENTEFTPAGETLILLIIMSLDIDMNNIFMWLSRDLTFGSLPSPHLHVF